MAASKEAVLRVVGKDKDDNSDRKRALEAALSQIDRAFGKGSVMKLGAREAAADVQDAVESEDVMKPIGAEATVPSRNRPPGALNGLGRLLRHA